MPRSDWKPIRYATHELRQIVWKFKDVEGLPPLMKEPPRANSPEDIYTNFRFLFDGEISERFVVFVLDSNNKVRAIDMVTQGTLNASLVHPREVFRTAIVGHAAAIIIAHNHPSGSTEPSREDIEITRQVVDAGKIIGIPVHDHLIFTQEGYTSFAERGLV